ncbi:hypothetical protein BDN70DRAFT_884475 [Pholiota conissans]|uniref:Flavin reductase like domain-containing protein n=1 Tax=Pholiota conissans TaxID=109636 RepID=A0A9P6CQ72_9AGAR|nr:hypothetical protein BDN70DRAFT_884475 [Pholiota conissans]
MSRTVIRKQCRSLSGALPSFSTLLHDNTSRAPHCKTAHRDRQSTPRRLAHSARAQARSEHGRHPTLASDADFHGTKKLKEDLRHLLRDIAQPVAVVTSFMPPNERAASSTTASVSGSKTPAISALHDEYRKEHSQDASGSKYHGATLSSFTSIAMDPYPLVAFALRIPSRMATTLSSLALSTLPSSSSAIPHQTNAQRDFTSHMVINFLSASQASAAITFSRPDLYPTPFVSGSQSEQLEYTLSADGLPILQGVVGALSCKLVGGPIPLHDLDYFSSGPRVKPKQPVLNEGDVASELFIARIVRVEDVRSLDAGTEQEERERTLPLVYHRRSYTSCHPRPSRIYDKKRE